jgi:conjugal transfer pilus assembly protein TraE
MAHMKLGSFTTSWAQAVRENATKNIVIAVLIGTNALAVVGWFETDKTVVLVPPLHDERMEVSSSHASEGYKRAWALTVAQLAGNVTPGNADLVLQMLGDLLSPSAYRAIAADLAAQIKDIKRDSITVSFEPREIRYASDTSTVYVSGQFSSKGVSGSPIKAIRTYEIAVDIRFGRPWVTRFLPYEGLPDIDGTGKPKAAGKSGASAGRAT